MHRFCGLCGSSKPHDWWCKFCAYENLHYHRFCGMCGKSCELCDAARDSTSVHQTTRTTAAPTSTTTNSHLGYEDMGLPASSDAHSVLTEESEAIRAAAARLQGISLQDTTSPAHHQEVVVDDPAYYDQDRPYHHQHTHSTSVVDDDEELSFAGDSCGEFDGDGSCGGAPIREVHAPQPTTSTSHAAAGHNHNKDGPWSCSTCTFLNENPLFLRCDMCGSARPATPPASPDHRGEQQQQQAPVSSIPQRNSSGNSPPQPATNNHQQPTPTFTLQQPRRASTTSKESDKSDKSKERRITELMRAQFANSNNNNSGNHGTANKVDHELALIYAQQERILAEYQRQQQQQPR